MAVVELYLFKNCRGASIPKHTGFYFKDEEDEYWRIDFGGGFSGTKVRGKYLQRIDDFRVFMKQVETSELAAILPGGLDNWIISVEKAIEKDYHLFTNNCRDFCRNVLLDLKNKGAKINENALSMLDTIQKNDTLIGIGMTVGLALIVGIIGAIGASGRESGGDKKRDEEGCEAC